MFYSTNTVLCVLVRSYKEYIIATADIHEISVLELLHLDSVSRVCSESI